MKTFGILICLIGVALGSLWVEYEPNSDKGKVNGVSIVNPSFEIDSARMATVSALKAGWIAVIPFGFSRQGEPDLKFNSSWQWWGEKASGTKTLIELAHQCGLKVMVKPHVWVDGNWIGEYDLDSEDDWKIWEQEYRAYILTYARLAAETNAEMLCIGTEYKIAVQKRPVYWSELADEIRQIYAGPLTYAANWDNFTNVTFWDKLDYIGVDAYFPLVQTDHPTIDEIREAWQPLKQDLKAYSETFDRPILFAEYGYQSADGAAGNHWEVDPNKRETWNMQVQSDSYTALYQEFWDETWFAGGFLWKWHFKDGIGGLSNGDFTPQGKPAAEVIAKWYGEAD